jgi:diguanylate cyclase (GGDEF)-like protein/PAS domain S-box-containing protein
MANAEPEKKPTRAVQRSKQLPAAGEVDFRALLDGSLDVVCLIKVSQEERRCLYATPSTLEVLGWTAEEFMLLSPAAFLSPESMALVDGDIAEILDGQPSSVLEIEAIRKDGCRIWLECMVRALGKKEGEFYVAVCMRDVTRRKNLEEQLAHMAMIDALTAIANRRAFDERIKQEWRRASRTSAPLSMVLLDVDHFKSFNDNYGHQLGDDCLRAIANTVRQCVKREDDFVARYGGEEIAVVLPATDLQGAAVLANEFCRAIADLRIPHSANTEGGGMVSVSCGAASAKAPLRGATHMPEALLFAADRALYKAKNAGRNRTETAETEDESAYQKR